MSEVRSIEFSGVIPRKALLGLQPNKSRGVLSSVASSHPFQVGYWLLCPNLEQLGIQEFVESSQG